MMMTMKIFGMQMDAFWRLTPALLHDLLRAATEKPEKPVRKTKYADVAGW